MQVLVHFAVFERIDGGFLERRVRGGEAGEEGCEVLAHFEGVGHGKDAGRGSLRYRLLGAMKVYAPCGESSGDMV